ncbi:MAG: hypothetical protein AAGP08_16370 [Pseudomonadota bacterium]
MTLHSNAQYRRGRSASAMRSLWLGVSTTALLALPLAAGSDIPLEAPMARIGHFETANMLPRDTVSVQIGTHQTGFDTGGGTGNQTYYGALEWAADDNLTLGFGALVQEDSNNEPIAGITTAIRFVSAALTAKYQFIDRAAFDVAAVASVESLEFDTALFGTNVSGATNVIGSVHVPITYQASPRLQFHVTPGVSVFPDDLNGIAYYGTVASLGVGATWQASQRLQVYGTLNQPLSGGNTIDTNRDITEVLVYTFGGRYNFTPKVALEAYVTNGVGTTPATNILTFWPDGDEPLFGLKLHYTPAVDLPDSYRPGRAPTLTARDRQLQQDGFILSTASVLSPGDIRVTASGGTDDNYAAALAISPDRDFQIDALVEEHALDGSVPTTLDPTPGSARWALGGRIRVLDQNAGDPVSLSLRVLGGRDLDDIGNGALYAAVPVTYEVNDRLAVTGQLGLGAFGNAEIIAGGIGANFEVFEGLQLIGETSVVSEGSSPVWAAGARYTPDNGIYSVDLSATNSIARHGYGSLVAQDETRFAVGVSVSTSIFGN